MESNKVENELTQEAMQNLWDQEANKLDAGGDASADENRALAAELQETEAQPQIEEPVEPETQQAEPQNTETQNEDPLASLPEAVRAKLAQIDDLALANAQLLHHVKTAEGRVAAMQREFDQARKAQTQVDEAPSSNQIASAVKNPEKWEELKQDFPEWAGAMEEYVTAKLGGINQQPVGITPDQVVNYTQSQLTALRSEMAQAVEEARIEGKYEDWKDTVNTTEFTQWFSVQKPEIRALAESSKAKDAIHMLDLFSDAKKNLASGIKQDRGQRLAAAASTKPGQTPPPKTLDDLSPEELWNYEATKREKQKAQRGF
jgi:hypothetical protein